MLKKSLFIASLLVSFIVQAENIRFAPKDGDLYLATKFLKTTYEDKKDNLGNFVISPLSVYAATTLLANGATGRTFEELENNILDLSKKSKAVNFFQPEPKRTEDQEATLNEVNQRLSLYIKEKSQFEMNNSVWGDEFLPTYIESVKTNLNAEAKSLPAHTSTINEWIEEKTKKRIQKMLPEKHTQKNEFYLVNTVYFKDEWQSVFIELGTAIQKFHSLDGQMDDVYMMAKIEVIDYYEDDKIQAVRLPYKNADVMQILLPKQEVNFNEFIQKLSAQDLYLKYYPVPVFLKLPRFKTDLKISMNDYFKKWHIQSIFDTRKASLPMLSNEPKIVTDIIHQANINVFEKGTEAAAATVISGKRTGRGSRDKPLSPKEWYIPFFAERPFIFMINNGDFIGVYTKGKLVKISKLSE